MADTRKILDERLARGEITIEQHKKIVDAMVENVVTTNEKGEYLLKPKNNEDSASGGALAAAAIAILILGGWYYYRSNSMTKELATYCVEQGNPSEKCQCVGERLVAQINFSAFLPIVGDQQLNRDPSLESKMRAAVRACSL